ncbi:hypothetical protein N9W84_00090 [bacterium]|nr:hypothetical protein [bacterium]
MNNLRELRIQAEKALAKIKNGKTFPTKYVLDRLNKAADAYPRDILICTARDVIQKKSSSSNFITQQEIYGIYNSLYNYSGGHSKFREAAGDLLPSEEVNFPMPTKNASASRDDVAGNSKTIFADNESTKQAADSFSHIFSLSSEGSFSTSGNKTIRKAEKFAKLQLNSLGCSPKSISAVKNNEHFILCKASFQSVSTKESSLSIPVQVKNGNPVLPEYFISEGNLVPLNKENVLVYLKSEEADAKRTELDAFASQRRTDSVSLDRVVVPQSLKSFANLEDDLMTAASKFSKEEVNMARSVVDMELKGFGFKNPQVKVAGSVDNGILFSVDLPAMGKISSVEVPVKIRNGKALYPSTFICENKSYDFNKSSVLKIASKTSTKSVFNHNDVNWDSMSYHSLINTMEDSAAKGNFKMAEDCLSQVQAKFSGQQVVNALNKYSSLLKKSSSIDQESFIKEAVRKGDLIKTPTSFDLYSPKYGMYLSKLAFDSQGNLIPKRNLKYDNQKESNKFEITSYNIKIN